MPAKRKPSKSPEDKWRSLVPVTAAALAADLKAWDVSPDIAADVRKLSLFTKPTQRTGAWVYYRYCREEDGVVKIVCLLCARVTGVHGTSNMLGHLTTKHKERMDKEVSAPPSEAALAQRAKDAYRSESERAVIYWLIKDMRPIRSVLTEAFRDMTQVLSSGHLRLSISHETVMARVMHEHLYLQNRVLFSFLLVIHVL
jgi:hypothetical protein